MKTATAPLQVQYDETLLGWLKKFIADNPAYTTKRLCADIGISAATLKLYLDGSYFGSFVKSNNGKLEEQIRHFRRVLEGRQREGYSPKFLETAAFRELCYGFEVAIQERQIALLYAESGVGKTTAIREWIRRNADLNPIYLLVSPNTRVAYFAAQLLKKLGIERRGTVAQIEESLADALRGTHRLVIVDNANYLGHDSLGIVRQLWETAGTPFALVGTRQLYQRFTAVNLTGDIVSQLSSRVAFCHRLSGLSSDELRIVASAALPEADAPFLEALETAVHGNFCALDMLLPRVIRLVGRNCAALESGEIKLSDLVAKAAKNLIL